MVNPTRKLIDVSGPANYVRLEAANTGVPRPVPEGGAAIIGKIVRPISGRYAFVLDSITPENGLPFYHVFWFDRGITNFLFMNPDSFEIPARATVPYCNQSYAGTKIIMTREELGVAAAAPPNWQEITFFLARPQSPPVNAPPDLSRYSCYFFRPESMIHPEFIQVSVVINRIDPSRLN